MSKKAPVKKSKRRLKRSVRRSLAAVLMITAIGVAAIPVPENVAATDDIATYAAVADTHTVYSYNELKTAQDSSGGSIAELQGLFEKDTDNPSWLGSYDSGKSDTDQSVTIEKSLKIYNNSQEEELTWEYKYYKANDAEKNIVLCKYNDRYQKGSVNLAPSPNIEYFKIMEDDFNGYFTTGNTTVKVASFEAQMAKNPLEQVKYAYSDYEDNHVQMMARGDWDFFNTYAKELFDAKMAAFEKYAKYLADKAAHDSQYPGGEVPYPGETVVKPDDLEITMAAAIGDSSENKIKFFCDNCITLKNYGDGYTLKGVRDTTGDTTAYAYVAWGGTPTGLGIKNDGEDNTGYMVTKQGDYVTAIGEYAFTGVGNVDNISLPTLIHYIGDNAFNNCTSITEVDIANVATIGNGAFQACESLKKVSMGSGVSKVGVECFEGCIYLESVEFSLNTVKIGAGAFANCNSLRELDFNNIIKSCEIGAAAFYNCDALTQVYMADSNIVKIGDSAFATVTGDNMTEFTFPSTIADNQDALGNRLFSGRAKLATVVFPKGYGRNSSVTIPESMFHGCSNLQYVEFPTAKGTDANANANLKYTTGEEITSNELFADVLNKDFYISGPKEKSNGDAAAPRESTWSAVTRAYGEPGYVPYLYYENGVEYYEICSGDYLECIRKNPDGTGTLTSCTLRPGATATPGGTLTIPDKVGDTIVVAIDSDCFSSQEARDLSRTVKKLIINDNIKEIAASTFDNSNSNWNRLEEVTIGSSVETIGANAFLNCTNLTDITFKTPVGNDYTKLNFPDSALQTKGNNLNGLTIHGDIVEGYRPFEYATDPKTYAIDANDGRRVCYQSRWDSPTSKHMTVMYGDSSYSSGGLVTLLDYPKYSELEDTESSAGAELAAHNREREQQFYENYAGERYDDKRIAFVIAWLSASSDEDVYNRGLGTVSDNVGGSINPLYGPWISEEFCNNWTTWVERAKNAQNMASANGIFDWLFEPITAKAAGAAGESNVPQPYFEINPYNFMTNYKKYGGNEDLIPIFNDTGAVVDYMGWNSYEKEMINSVVDIVVPAGVESIDVYDYYNLNRDSFNTYLRTKTEYTSTGGDIKNVVPGLFSGNITDYEDPNEKGLYEVRGENGNDRIQSVTMSSVIYLPDYAFDNCERLSTVILGDAMQHVGALPFRDCIRMVNLIGNEKYPAEYGILYERQDGEAESYKIIECLLTRGAVSPLDEKSISDGFDSRIPLVSAIAENAFADCDSVNVVNLYSASLLTEILDGTFSECDNLALITLPASVNDIQDGAFAGICKRSTLDPRCQIYIYGSEVSISDNAFGKDSDLREDKDNILEHAKERIKIWAYDNTAAARYAKYYNKEGMEFQPLSASETAFSVIFMDYDGTQIGNTQFVINDYAEVPDTTELEKTDHRPGYRFSGWLGTNGQDISKKISDNCIFFAQYDSDGTMINGKYVIEFLDGIDGRQLSGRYADIDDGKYYIEAGKSFADNGWEAPIVLGHEGYAFLKWSNDWTEDTKINSSMTVIALYEPGESSGNRPGGNTSGSSSSTQTPSSNTTSLSGSSTSSSSTSSGSSTSTTSTTTDAAGLYTLLVINGSGSGSYAAGTTVVITANAPATGQVFNRWTTETQGVTFTSSSLAATTFVMPASNTTVTAEFVSGAGATPASTAGGGNGGNGGSGGTAVGTTGSTRVDITKPGISNKDLATATVNGSTDNFIVKISETPEATQAVANALTNKYGNLDNILYYAMDISLYDSTGTTRIPDITGLTVDITIPIPDALVAYGGNNMAGAVVSNQIATDQMEDLGVRFSTINGVPCISFTATHFSPYTIYVDTSNLAAGMLDVTPKTGDPIHPKWFLSLGLACLSVILFIKKDKRVVLKNA